MAGIPKEHDSLYFDALVRTQKKESLEAMIKATYYAKKNYDNEEDVKSDIAKRLESAYGLLRDNVKGYDNGVGSYTGTLDQFASQYTLGHEMAIWTNSSLDLNPLAVKVAENIITVTEYMDIIFLNYFQPVNGVNVHPLYQILDYLLKRNKTVLDKNEMENALGVPCRDGAKNALFNLLGDTSYFDIDKNTLVFSGKDSIKNLLKKCDILYIGKEGYEKSKEELKDNNKYMNYIINPHNEIIATEDADEIEPLNNFMAYFNKYKNDWIKMDEDTSKDIEAFKNEYPLERIKNLNPEEYVVGLGKSNNSLCYDIEFGKYKGIVGIGGGTSLKFGVYYSKEENSYKYKNEIIDIDEFWPKFINQLYDFLVEITNDVFPIDFDNKYPLLRGMGMMLAKLAFIYNPQSYLNIGQRKGLREIMDHFDYSYTREMKPFELGRHIKENFIESVPELSGYGDSCIGNALWDYLHEVIREDGNDDDEYIDAEEETKTSLIDIHRTPRINTIYPLNFILYGAPGTGKTYSTSEYAVGIIENFDINKTNMSRNEITEKYRHYIDKGQIVFTTFHQNYGYEEFIQGLRPDTSSNELSFKVCDGVFKSIADKALRDDQNDYVIIIDEINRGNISRVFGELITLIEEDKRWGEANEMYVTLPYGELFTIPNNLYIIGTMNSADKSISLVDTALRRRFNFIEKSPNLDLIADAELRKVVNALNEYIVKELRSSDLVIGHSFFIGKTVKDLDTIMNEQIIPLLYEYFFEDEQKVKKALDAVSIAHYEDLDENGEKTTYVFTTSQKVFSRLQVCVEKKVGVNVE